MNLGFGFILLLGVLSSSSLIAQSNVAQGTLSHKQQVFLFDVNGLRIVQLSNIAKVSNCYKQDDIVNCDTLSFEKDKYKGFDLYDIDGVVTLKLKIPIIVNSKLLQSDDEKFTVLSQICEEDIKGVYFINRKRAERILRNSIKPFHGCMLIEGIFEGKCNR